MLRRVRENMEKNSTDPIKALAILMPSGFSMTAFNDVARDEYGSGTVRWVAAPTVYVDTRPEGFTSAEQFATLAHAAKNTQVPFVLLKHRVLTERQSLEEAIRASKPELDARAEAARARTAARSDIASLSAPAPHLATSSN